MEKTQIAKGISIIDLGLFLEKPECLVIADLQLGYEEIMNKKGIMMPRFNFQEIKERLEGIFKKTSPKTIALNGDLKQGFGKATEQEWKETLELFKILKKNSKEIVVVKGNHDVSLGPITKWEELETVKEFYLEGEKVLLTHGDKINQTKELKQCRTIIIGHEHPAVTIREGAKTEKFKCFLKGKYMGKDLIIQPSISPTAAGTNVLENNPISPFLKKGFKGFEVWAIEDKPYYVGKIQKGGLA